MQECSVYLSPERVWPCETDAYAQDQGISSALAERYEPFPELLGLSLKQAAELQRLVATIEYHGSKERRTNSSLNIS